MTQKIRIPQWNCDKAVYDFIQKKRSEGKCGKEAMIASLNKFLRVYYGRVMERYSEL